MYLRMACLFQWIILVTLVAGKYYMWPGRCQSRNFVTDWKSQQQLLPPSSQHVYIIPHIWVACIWDERALRSTTIFGWNEWRWWWMYCMERVIRAKCCRKIPYCNWGVLYIPEGIFYILKNIFYTSKSVFYISGSILSDWGRFIIPKGFIRLKGVVSHMSIL